MTREGKIGMFHGVPVVVDENMPRGMMPTILDTPYGPRYLAGVCYTCGEKWAKGDEAISTRDFPQFHHRECGASMTLTDEAP